MFPNVDIEFENGQLGQIIDTPDGVFCLVASAVAVGATFLLETPYSVRNMVDVATLGIVPDVDNYRLHKALSEFYAEAEEGTELWIYGMPRTEKVSNWFKPDATTGKAPIEKVLDTANGRIKMLFTAFSPSGNAVIVPENGLDPDVWLALTQAQNLADNYTAKKYAPFFVLMEGYGFTGDKTALADLTQKSFNRCQLLLGDTETRTGVPASKGAAVGLLAGRYSKVQVHTNVGKVRDGAVASDKVFILDAPVELYDTQTLHDKGFVTFRTHARKSGYFFSDCPMVCAISDDYHYATNRRVIDKAFTIAYDELVEFLLDDVNVNGDGTIQAIDAKNIENIVETAIYNQMTANGELSADPSNPSDRGVICKIDLTHNVTSTSKLKVSKLQVATKASLRYINVPLGFVPVTPNT